MTRKHLDSVPADRIREKLTALAEGGSIGKKDFYKESDEAVKDQYWFLMESVLEINFQKLKEDEEVQELPKKKTKH